MEGAGLEHHANTGSNIIPVNAETSILVIGRARVRIFDPLDTSSVHHSPVQRVYDPSVLMH